MGTDINTGPYASGETGGAGLAATFSSGSLASSCPRPSSVARGCCSLPLSWAAGGLGVSSLGSNKEATVLSGWEGKRLQVHPVGVREP